MEKRVKKFRGVKKFFSPLPAFWLATALRVRAGLDSWIQVQKFSISGTSQLLLSLNIFLHILVTFQISNIPTSDWARGWGSGGPWLSQGKVAPGRVRAEDIEFCQVRLG